MGKRSQTLITKRLVDGLGANQTIWDRDVRGFHVRRQVHDRVYGLSYRQNRRDRYVRIGLHGSPWTPDMARRRALELLGAIVKGEDPRERKSETTIADLCERFLRDHAEQHKAPASVQTDRSNINNHIIPLLGSRRVSEITKTDIQQFQRAIREGQTAADDPIALQKAQRGGAAPKGGPGVANRCLALLSTMFNLAEEWGWRPPLSNPARGITRYPENKRERFLSKEEFARLGAAIDNAEGEESPFALAAIRLLLLTGARRNEILGLRWDYVDLERGLLNLPKSKTGAKTIRLAQPAIEIIQALPRLHANPFVIAGHKQGSHLVNLDTAWRRICSAAGLRRVRIHDMRHSFASVAIANGVPLQVIGGLLGHARSETTERYAHLGADRLQAASTEVGMIIDDLLHAEIET